MVNKKEFQHVELKNCSFSRISAIAINFFFRAGLGTFVLIVYAHSYCARNSCRNAMLRHARARAQRKKSIHIKGWHPLR